jgi:hypothetical protein
MSAKESSEISRWHAEGLPAFRTLAKWTQGPLADSRGVVGGSRGSGSAARGFPRVQGPAAGVRQAPADGGIRPRTGAVDAGADVLKRVPPQVGCLADCLIEMEGPHGKMRIQWKGSTAPDLAGLSRVWNRRDSDHAADAHPDSDRGSGWQEGDRFPGSVVPGETPS